MGLGHFAGCNHRKDRRRPLPHRHKRQVAVLQPIHRQDIRSRGTPLTSDEAWWIDQLFSSYDVFRIERDATNPDEPLVLTPVLITDCTCEIQDGDEKLNTVKFTWRHTDNHPIVRLSASHGIFTSPYNIVYS